jgi:hypothetical protein
MQAVSPRSPNGATPWPLARTPVWEREPGELNHLMYPEEEIAVP